MMAALFDEAKTSEKKIDNINLTKAEKTENFSGERDAANTRLRKVFFSLRPIIKSQKRMKDNAADILTKFKELYEHARVRVFCSHATRVAEFREGN